MPAHPASGDVPEADRAGAVDAGQQVAVRREGDGFDLVPVPGQLRLRRREKLLPQVPAAQADLGRFRFGHQTAERWFDHQTHLEDLADAASRTAYESSSSWASNISRRRRWDSSHSRNIGETSSIRRPFPPMASRSRDGQ